MVNKTLKTKLKIGMACCLLVLLLTSCEPPSDFHLKSLMLIKPPHRLIYISGQDNELVLYGSRIVQYRDLYGGLYHIIDLDAYDYNFDDGKYFHTDVDFEKEGTYLVSIAKAQWFSWQVYFQYTVQVIPVGEYKISTSVMDDNFKYEEIEPTEVINVSAYMTSPPSNIIYPIGYTGEIDLSGIVVKAAKGWFPKEYDIADLDYTLESDVDFSTPGSYIVKVYFTDDKGTERWFCFTVAVAEKAEK